MSESQFREVFSKFGNSERYEDGKKIINYTLHRQIDNKFNLSYHLEFPQKGVQFNFWFDKISYINSVESVTISLHDKNEKNEEYRLKTILKTNCIKELKTKVDEFFNQYN